ncbi:hypothetical protein [Duncaniella dubosii]
MRRIHVYVGRVQRDEGFLRHGLSDMLPSRDSVSSAAPRKSW